MKIIKTKKFILRPFAAADAKSVTENVNNWNVIKTLSSLPYPYELKHAKEWIAGIVKDMKKKDSERIVYAIEVDGKAVGSIGVHAIKEKHKGEIGYWLGENYWGSGIMSEALKRFTQLCFRDLKLKRVYAKVYLGNIASEKVLLKSGFEHEGLLKKEAFKNGKYIDCKVFAKVK